MENTASSLASPLATGPAFTPHTFSYFSRLIYSICGTACRATRTKAAQIKPPDSMPCDYKTYPLNWFSEIRKAAIARANNACQDCGTENYSLRYLQGTQFCTNDSFKQAQHRRYESGISDVLTIVVLTVVHLDSFPMNNAPENLRVLCLRCANRRDAKRRAKIRKTKRLDALEAIAPSLPLVTSIITKL